MGDIKNEKPLSLQDMLEYLKTLRDDHLGFAPYRIFSAVITNEKYCPEEFSQEIEDSEEDKYTERMEFRKKYFDPIWGWGNPVLAAEYEKLKNSEKWMINHAKNCPLTVDYNIVGICMCRQKKITLKSELCEIEKIWRDYDTEINRQKLTDYYDKLTEKGLKIYQIV